MGEGAVEAGHNSDEPAHWAVPWKPHWPPPLPFELSYGQPRRNKHVPEASEGSVDCPGTTLSQTPWLNHGVRGSENHLM